MTLSNLIAMKPIFFFFALVIIEMMIPTLVISIWHLVSKRIEHETKFSSHYVHQEALSGVQTAAGFLFPTNSSAVNLAKILHSPLNGSDPTLPMIETMVAPSLFLTLKALQLSQITFFGNNSLLYSYYIEGEQTFVVYSNASNDGFVSSANTALVYNCYTELVDEVTGSRLGKGDGFNINISVDSSWFEEVSQMMIAYSSLGTSWGKSHELLFLSTASMGRVGLVSLGLPVRAFREAISKTDLQGGELYMITENGILLTKTGNLSVMIENNNVSIISDDFKGIKAGEIVNFTCEPSDDPLRMKNVNIGGAKQIIYCSEFEVAGVLSASIIVFPQKGLVNVVCKDSKLTVALLGVLLGSALLSITFFIILIVGTVQREVVLSAELINQTEATHQAERKSMNKSMAFASASHDVRSSLAALVGLIDFCRGEVNPNSGLFMNLQQMEKSVADLVVLLNSILDTSKLEARKMQLTEEEFDMAQVLEESVNFYYAVAYNKGVDIILDPCDASVLKCSLVKGDRGKFKQILSNLLHNAIKFTLEGSITIRAWAKKPSFENKVLARKNSGFLSFFSRLVFRNNEAYNDLGPVPTPSEQQKSIEFVVDVADTGKGILKDKWKSVFEDFVQVRETALEHGGTGLGLGIVQSLVRLMGGDIRIVDKEPGERGTCFRFNVFFHACETTSTVVTEREDLNAQLLVDRITINSSQPTELGMRSPVPEGSNVVLFIQGNERREVLQKFFQSIGIRVLALDRFEHLLPTLKKMKYGWNFNFSSSGNSELGGTSDCLCNSPGHGSKDGSISCMDGGENILPLHRMTSSKGNSRFLLIVIDFSGANFNNDQFAEFSSVFERFIKDVSASLYKVVWLYTPSPDSERRQSEENMLAHCELIVSRPLHGSRLYQVLKLLPEFGAAATIQCYRANPVAHIREPSGNSSPLTPKSLIPQQHHEIQIGPSGDHKPLLGKKVLLVDDDLTLRLLGEKVLDKLGATTLALADGTEAVGEVSSALTKMKGGPSEVFPYAYVLFDCEMEFMSGYEATKQIRTEERAYGIHIPIIALTAHMGMEEEEKTKAAGMDYHLTKPLTVQKMLAAISYIDNKKNQPEIRSA